MCLPDLPAAYILRDEFRHGKEPNPIGDPRGADQIPLVVQDRQFNRERDVSVPDQRHSRRDPWIGEIGDHDARQRQGVAIFPGC